MKNLTIKSMAEKVMNRTAKGQSFSRGSSVGRPWVSRGSSVGHLSFTNALRNLCVSFAHRSRLVATLLLLVTMSIGQVWASSAHFNLIGQLNNNNWNVNETSKPINKSTGNDSEYYIELEISAGTYYFALNNGSTRYQSSTSTRTLVVNGSALPGTYNSDDEKAFKVEISKTGTYRIVVNQSASEWYPTVKITYDAQETLYTITVVNGTPSSVEAGSVTHPSITANAPATGKRFDRWTTTGGASVASATSATTTVSASATGTVTATYVDVSYYLKTNWGGGSSWDWSEDALTDNGNGTYSIDGVWGGNGCNWNTSASDPGSKWIDGNNCIKVGNPASGDECTFTLNPTANSGNGSLTITKKETCTTGAPSIAWNNTPVGGTVGGNMTASVTVPDGSTVAWTSTNTSVATINGATGAISYKAAGTTTIRATVTNRAYCTETNSIEKIITVSAAPTYTLTVAKGANIATVSGGKADQASVPFDGGTISATPATGYDFASWTASPAANAEFGNAANASTTVTVKNGSVTVTASATEHMNTITIVGGTAASATAGIATTGTATAAEPAGKRFTSWTVPGSNFTLSGCLATDKTITFNATANGIVTANYADITYCRLYYSNPEGWSTVKAYLWQATNTSNKNADWSGEDITDQYETINGIKYYYVEFDSGRGFDRVIFNNGSAQTKDWSFSNTDCGKYTKTNKDKDAVWENRPAPETKYTVNIVNGTPTSVSVGSITSAEITANAAEEDYQFDSWVATTGVTVDHADQATANVNATQEGTVSATYAPKDCKLYVVNAAKNGTVQSQTSMTYDEDAHQYYIDVTTNAKPYYFRFLIGTNLWCSDWKDTNYNSGKEIVANGDKIDVNKSIEGWTDKPAMYFDGATGTAIRIYFDQRNKQAWITRGCTTPTIAWETAPADGNEGGNMTASVTRNDTEATVTWTSSNPAVATVSNTGVITYKSAGTTTITASYTGSGDFCATERSISKNITVSAASIIYAYLNVQYQVGNDWNSNDENVEILDGKLTGKTLGEYTVTRGGAPVTVRVYQYYIKHPWNTGDANNGTWVWKAMTIKNGKPTYTGAAGDAGANIAWSIENKDGETGSIDGNVWKAGIAYTPSYTKGNMYDFVYDPGQALNGATAPTTAGTLTAKESNILKTTITFAAQTFTVAGTAGSEGGAVKSTAGVSGSAIAQGKQVTFTAEAAAGYIFEGWYSEAACTNKVSDKAEYTATMPEDDENNTYYAIYAKFQQKAALVLVLNGDKNMTDKGNGVFTYEFENQTKGNYTFAIKVGSKTWNASIMNMTEPLVADGSNAKYIVEAISNVTITATYNGYNENMDVAVTIVPTGVVASNWYLLGNSNASGNWKIEYSAMPMNKLFRATPGVYYYELTTVLHGDGDKNSYFRVRDSEKQYGFYGNDNKYIQVGYSRAETLEAKGSGNENVPDRNLAHGIAETIYVIADTRAAAETNTIKVWYEKTLPTCHSVLVTNGAGGTYTLKTASGFATTQMAEGEGYKLTITPEAGRRTTVTVDGQEVALTNNGDGTFTYSGTMVKENQNVVISYTEPQDITIKMHVNCGYWQGHDIYAQYKNEGADSWKQVQGTAATALAGYTNWVTYTFSKDAFTGGLVQFTISSEFKSDSNNDWSDQITLTQFDDSYCYELVCDKTVQGRKLVKTDCPTLGVELVVKNADKIGGTAALSSVLSATGEATYAYYLSKNGADYHKLVERETAEYLIKEAGTYQYKVVVSLNGETAEAESEVITVAQPKLSIQPSSSAVGTKVPVTLTPTIEGIASGASMYLCFTITKGGEVQQSITVDNTDGYKVTFTETGEYTIHTELKLGTDCEGEALASTENVITVSTMTIKMTSSDANPVIGSNIRLTTTVTGAEVTNYYVTVKSSTEPMPKQVYNGSTDHFDFTVASEETYTFRATVTIGGQEYEASTVVTAQAKDVYINYPWTGGAMPDDIAKIQMTYAGDGVYTYYEEGQSKFRCGTDMEVTADGVTIAKGTTVTFTYDPSTDKLSFVQGGNVAPTVGPTEDGNPSGADWYLKHPWNGGSWQYVGMKRNDNGTYSVSGAWGNDGVDVRRGSNGQQWNKTKSNIYTTGMFKGAYIYKPSKTVIETPILIDLTDENCGTDAIFSYNINRNELTIMRASSTLNRIKVTTGGETYYSNEISEDGEVSFFANQSATLTWEQFGNCVTTWTEITTLTNPVTHGGIYVADATISGHSISNVAEYNDDFYIYSHLTGLDEETIDTYAVTGNNGVGQFGAAMTKFEVVDPERQFYNHYWVEWVNKDRDAYATVGNKINRNLSKVLPSYSLPVGTNLRYGFNPNTNYFGRSFLKGSTEKTGDWFLQLYGSNVFDKTTPTNVFDNSTTGNRANFSDGSNWEYPVEVRCLAPSQMKVIANYNGQVTYLLDKNGLSVTTRPMLQESTLGSKLIFEVVYDYKTNLITLGWIPEPEVELTGDNVIKADIIIRRTEDENPTFINLGTGATVSGLMKATAELEINRKTIFNNDHNFASDAKRMYWFSLPYDCAIKDIYGIDGYGTKWYIERYRGDMRARYGLTSGSTYWTIMNATATLKANVGYVIVLDQLSWDDFKTVGTGKDEISRLRLYFPSAAQGFHLENNMEFNTTVPSYICNITSPVDRRQDDSNWSVIGVPGFMNAQVNNSFEYFYTWTQVGEYNAQDVSTYAPFAPTKAFMVQYAGLVSWNTNADVQQGAAHIRAKNSAKRTGKYCIRLTDINGKEDKTFITLSEDGTDDYIMGKDMSKIFNSKMSLIYTQMKDRDFMANDVCDTTTHVALTTKILTDGEYTISLREGDAWQQTPFLYDAELNTYTDLSTSDYTFYGVEGEDNARFSIVFGYKAPQVTTDVENVDGGDALNSNLEKIMLNGILYILRDGQLYNAMGNLVK